MGGFVAGLLEGAAPGIASGIERRKQEHRDLNEEDRRASLAPLSQAIQADQTRLALYADPKDPTKAQAGHEKEYEDTMNRMASTIGQMRTLLGNKAPGEEPSPLKSGLATLSDKLHITRHLASHIAENQSKKASAYYDQNRQQAGAYAAGAMPYEQTPEGQKESARTADALKEIEARNAAAGWTRSGQPVKVGEKWMQPFTNKGGETKMEAMPEGYNGPATKPNTSQYATQREAYARSLGKMPAQMDWNDEQNFLRQRYASNQPFATRKLALQEEKLHIDQSALQLRYAQNNWKDFQDVFKNLGPNEKLQTTAQLADNYVTDPTGPGDVALTLAFFEVAKAADPGSGSGIRFTQQEQKLIQGSRGWADAAKANVERWGSGTLYDDNQRQQMAGIIKMAASKAAEKQTQLLGATGSLNPTATGAAASAAGVTPPAGPKTKALKGKTGEKHKIKIGNKVYTYNGSGDTADLKNYTEVAQ